MAWSPQLDYRTEGGRARGAHPVQSPVYWTDLGREGVNTKHPQQGPSHQRRTEQQQYSNRNNNLVLFRKNPRRSHPLPTDTRSAGANRSPLHPTKLPPRPRTAISGCMAIGFGMGKGREGGGGPNSGPFYLVLCGPARACWRHSRGIQRRPRRGGVTGLGRTSEATYSSLRARASSGVYSSTK
jgi:hypothetical protein